MFKIDILITHNEDLLYFLPPLAPLAPAIGHIHPSAAEATPLHDGLHNRGSRVSKDIAKPAAIAAPNSSVVLHLFDAEYGDRGREE